MEHIGAGLAALGVIGPGIGIGILAGLSATAIGRNPDAAGQIRGLAIILAAFAEGLGVLAIVVGLLAIFIKPRVATGTEQPSWTCSPSRPGSGARSSGWPPRARPRPLFQINLFWSIIAAANFLAVPGDHLDVRVQAGLEDAGRPQGPDRAGAARTPSRRAGTARARSRAGRRPSPRRAARRTRSWPAPRRSPRRRATRTSPRPARSSSGCASAPPPRSRPRSSGRSPRSAPRSPTWPSRPPAGSSARR